MVRRKFIQTKFFWALVAFGVLSFFVFFQPRFLLRPAQTVIATVSWPAEKFLSFIAFEIRGTFQFFSSIGELKDENERLEAERLRLFAENARLNDIAKENEELRRELGILPREKYDILATEIIGRDVSGLGNWISIDQGALQGVQKGMPVIVGAGILVGKVTDVFPSSARVMLLSNGESFINGVTGDTEARGIVKGEYGLGLLFGMVLQEDALTAGDTVVTSGLGGDMPQGLLIGTIQEPHLSSDRLFREASLVSPVRLDDIQYLFVIRNAKKL